MAVPSDILIASLATLIVLMNGTFLTFPKGGRPAEILIKIFCGVATFFWVMAIFDKSTVVAYTTAGVLALIAFLIGPINDNTHQISPENVNMSPPTVQIGTEFDFPYIGKTGRIICLSGEEGNYFGILDETSEPILVYSEAKFETNEKFIITSVKNSRILIDKIEK